MFTFCIKVANLAPGTVQGLLSFFCFTRLSTFPSLARCVGHGEKVSFLLPPLSTAQRESLSRQMPISDGHHEE